ncbi:MAG: hypothetical protein LIO78_01360 [Clostridiales bacterium]|nr:hypothetical protein [Clostridiales bacterium]
MALINCPECGKQISDKAANCIHCGFPLSDLKGTGTKYFLILCLSGGNRANCAKLISEYSSVGLARGLQICDSNKEEIVLSDSDISKIESARHRFEGIGSTMRIACANSDAEIQLNERQISCPRCGSTSITTGQRGFSIVTGPIGSSKTTNRCAKCGYKWYPK